MQKLCSTSRWPIYGPGGQRQLEAYLQTNSLQPLMQLAGLAAAQLALAIAPHA